MSYYASYLGNCFSVSTPGETTLSGLPETTFALRFGSAPAYASTLDDAIQLVYVRSNYNRNTEANRGSLPSFPREYFSKTLVRDTMDQYRRFSGTGVVQHLTTETISAKAATDTYQQVTTALLPRYPAIGVETTRSILREWFYATIDGKARPSLLLPAAQRYPTPGALAMLALEDAQREVQEKKAELEKDTFLGRIGAGIANLFSAPGELASAATTTAKVAGVGAVVVGVGALGLIGWAVAGKIKQFDVNRAYGESQKTARKIGPDVARVAVTKGLA